MASNIWTSCTCPSRTGGSSARFTTTARSTSPTKEPVGSRAASLGGEHDGRGPRRNGRSCATTSSARRHGPNKITARSISENSAANMEDRALWTRAVAREAEKWGFSWSYWEFCSEFGAYDPVARQWRQPLLNALLGRE